MTNDHSGHSPSAKKPTVHLDKDKLAAARDRARAAATAAAQSPPPAAAPVAPPPPPALPVGSVEALLHGLYATHRAQVWASAKTFRAFMADVLATTLSQHQPAVDALTLFVEAGLPDRLVAVKAEQLAALLQEAAAHTPRPRAISLAEFHDALRCWVAALRPELASQMPGTTPANPALANASDAARRLAAMQQNAAARRVEEERRQRAEREARERKLAEEEQRQRAEREPRERKLAEQKHTFDTLYPTYEHLLNDPHVSLGELAEAWNLVVTALGHQVPATPAELRWTPAGPELLVRLRATREKPFANTLGMKFVPVPGTDVWFSIWETRVQDYAAFAATQADVDASWKNPVYENVQVTPGPLHPVVNVSWDDAQAFAKWLTEKERREGRLPAGASYRLPADWEWSVAVGLSESRNGTPKDKDCKTPNEYPWGTQWPPPPGAGNFADQTFKAKFPSYSSIEGYTDGFATTSPVGSFAANKFGLCDLAGNVCEWCEDYYEGSSGSRVLRGSSWRNRDSDNLLSSFRRLSASDLRGLIFGFRCVLVGVSSR